MFQVWGSRVGFRVEHVSRTPEQDWFLVEAILK